MENNFDDIAYIRKLNENELGYRNGVPKGAGRFFLVSKKAVHFFPPLSDNIINDNVFLDVIPPFSDDVVLTKYEYHNSATATDESTETRNEYRLYLNTGNDKERNYFKPDDIVVIVKIFSEENNFTYKLLRYKEEDKDYVKLNSFVIEKAINLQRSHAIVDFKELLFLDKIRKIDFGKRIIPAEVIKDALEKPVEHAFVEEEDKEYVTRVIRSRSFRDLTMYFYEGKCAITGKELVIDHRFLSNLEAAHILARASGGGSHPSNAVALERNLHWAFDKGFFTLTTDYKIEVHPDAMRIPYLSSKHGREIFTPQDDRSKPNKSSIEWHRKNVFGLFLRTDA